MSTRITVKATGAVMTRREFEDFRAWLAQENRTYPERLTPVDRSRWPPRDETRNAVPRQVLRNRGFLVVIWDERCHKRMTVNRTQLNDVGEFADGITWDELTRLKAEAGFGDWWAIEVYPPDEEVVNVANMRHLWLMSHAPSCAWRVAGE